MMELFYKNSERFLAVNFFLQKNLTINVWLCSKNGSVAYKKKKQIILCDFALFYIILYNFISCPVLIDIKQTLHYKVALELI